MPKGSSSPDLSLLEYLENPFALAQWIVSGKKSANVYWKPPSSNMYYRVLSTCSLYPGLPVIFSRSKF